MSAVFRPSVKILYDSLRIRFGTWKVRPLNQRRNSRLSQAGRMTEPFQIQMAVLNWFRRPTFHVFNSWCWVRLMKSSASELGLRPTVHTDPSRKRGFSKTLFKPAEFQNAGSKITGDFPVFKLLDPASCRRRAKLTVSEHRLVVGSGSPGTRWM